MSKENNEVNETIENEIEDDSLDLIRDVLDKLVPPSNVEIEDIFGNKYDLKTKISARSQIQLLRKFEQITKELKLSDFFQEDEEINTRSIISAIMKLAIDEEIMNGIEKCFHIAHNSTFEKAKNHCSESDDSVDNPTALDLFGLEDILSAIIPLFLGLIKKGTKTLTLLAQ